jgi:hypothetical protein
MFSKINVGGITNAAERLCNSTKYSFCTFANNLVFVYQINSIMKPTCLIALVACLFAACRGDGFKSIPTNSNSAWNLTGIVHTSPQELILADNTASAATVDTYKNFILIFECKTSDGAVGALHFHKDKKDSAGSITGYEVLLNNNADPTEWRKSGSLAAVRNFAKCMADNGEWTLFRIEVANKNIKVYVDGAFVVDYTEPQEPYRLPQYAGRKLADGVLALTNYSNAPIAFRNIRIKRLPDNLSDRHAAEDEQEDAIIRLSQQNFPAIDAHLHLKGGLTIADVEAMTRKYGITYGIAPNCGKNFPITNDEQIYSWLDSMRWHLFLLPMQAEGREWLDMFSDKATQKFDYIFTDALTWTDNKGRRMRIWIPEETFVDDAQQFMDMLVERACGIISAEPIDIYVNPTFLPDQLQPQYDALWTTERMTKVIDACVSKGVAVEINCRYRIPSPKFIKLAKQRGVKFSIGTNNAGADDVGKLEYAVEMIAQCGLTPQDMWIPTSKNK